jgi:hypothetical protein
MSAILKRVFTHEYRTKAVKLAVEQGLGVTEADKRLALSVDLFSLGSRRAGGSARSCGYAPHATGHRFTGRGESIEARISRCL